MQTSNPFLDDMAKLAGGALGALTGVKNEVEILVRQQFEKLLAGMDLVRRDEFEAIRDVAANARSQQEILEARVSALESLLSTLVATGNVAYINEGEESAKSED